ncbi:YfhH family protein [Virgibacillus sp. MSP4-1]|uniref:Transcriptional regulator n=1 Tax=Salinibacillus aidingensis TaxID=237684 RepID=A0ABN1BIE8_9BACI|nr:YfhH family protein [Virgibacillus sp. MSP4-1]QHS24289.1 YfhH family protein [Virgibacillus sp. MSP4-1]
MEMRYSDMTVEQLREEIARLTEKAQKAEQLGMVNEYAVYERKMMMAKAYMMDPAAYEAGDIYEIENTPNHYFKIDYRNGVFVWGKRTDREGNPIAIDTEQEALPISMLGNYMPPEK